MTVRLQISQRLGTGFLSLARIPVILSTIVFSTPAFTWAQVNYIEEIAYQDNTPAPSTPDPMADLLERLKQSEERIADLEKIAAEMEAPADKPEEKKEEKKKEKGWFEKYKLSGYTQFRINETLTKEPGSAPPSHNSDSSVAENNTFFIRRARLTLDGDVTDRIYIYLQPEFAGTVPNSPDAINYVQLRDWYADFHLDDDKEYRVRVGLSKVPFGWENLQSSRNRLPLDRNDGFNSAVKNERDTGTFFYWTPKYAQDFFKKAVDDNLKGSGNYGVFGIGFYSGQGGSLREQNDNLHFVTRLALPYTFANGQMTEVGVQAYTGKYTVLSAPISPLGVGGPSRPLGTLEQGNIEGLRDERIGATWVYYPQPLGFQAEWNVGRGPGLNDAQTEVIDRPLYGGYAMTMYRYQSQCHGEFWPFFRWSFYDGGYKSELNAPMANISEFELGMEWQMTKYLELLSTYTWTERTNTRSINSANTLSYQQFDGDLLRFQLQVRY